LFQVANADTAAVGQRREAIQQCKEVIRALPDGRPLEFVLWVECVM
jgi:hypothetical protein